MDIMKCINCLFLEVRIVSQTFNAIGTKYNTYRYSPISPEVPAKCVIRNTHQNNI